MVARSFVGAVASVYFASIGLVQYFRRFVGEIVSTVFRIWKGEACWNMAALTVSTLVITSLSRAKSDVKMSLALTCKHDDVDWVLRLARLAVRSLPKPSSCDLLSSWQDPQSWREEESSRQRYASDAERSPGCFTAEADLCFLCTFPPKQSIVCRQLPRTVCFLKTNRSQDAG